MSRISHKNLKLAEFKEQKEPFEGIIFKLENNCKENMELNLLIKTIKKSINSGKISCCQTKIKTMGITTLTVDWMSNFDITINVWPTQSRFECNSMSSYVMKSFVFCLIFNQHHKMNLSDIQFELSHPLKNFAG